MKSLKLSLLFSTVTGVGLLNAQTADEVINKHIEAIGGKEKISQIKSIYMETTMNIMGNEAPGTTYILNGKGFKSEVNINGQTITQVISENGGWSINPMTGATDPTPLPEEQFKASKGQIYVGGPLFNYSDKGNKVEFLGKEDNNYKIKLTTPENIVSTFFIDDSSYLINKSVTTGNMQGQDIEVTATFSDYQKSDYGYITARKIDTDFGGFSMAATVTKLEVNKEIDPAIFEMPK